MKIYVNLNNQPPSLATSMTTRSSTSSDAFLQYSFSGSVSSFEFKRGTTVPLEIVLAGTNVPDAAEITALKFALKPSGKYDTTLSAVADATVPGTLNADGTLSFFATLDVSSVAFDDALSVNSTTDDDATSAAFSAEISWENSAGEITATKTVSATISNNIYRAGDASAASLPSANWSAMMVVVMPWADFCALEELRDDVLYFCPDKPSEAGSVAESLAAHATDENAHATLFDAVNAKADANAADIEELSATVATASANAESALSTATIAAEKTATPATLDTLGVVRLGTNATISSGAVVGVDSNKRMWIRAASNSNFGAVKLTDGNSIATGALEAGDIGVTASGALRAVRATTEKLGVVLVSTDSTLSATDTFVVPSVSVVKAALAAETTRATEAETALKTAIAALTERVAALESSNT